MKSLTGAAEPGTRYNYNAGETQVVAEILRAATGRPLATYLSERIWTTFGMEADANWWLDSPGGTEIGGRGVSAPPRAFWRFVFFFLGGGAAAGGLFFPPRWVLGAATPPALAGPPPV